MSGFSKNSPSQVVSDLEKMSNEYGLKVAKAIETEWFHNDRGSNRYRTNYNNFHKLRLYARGEQSIQKPKLNINIAKYQNKGNMSKLIKE